MGSSGTEWKKEMSRIFLLFSPCRRKKKTLSCLLFECWMISQIFIFSTSLSISGWQSSHNHYRVLRECNYNPPEQKTLQVNQFSFILILLRGCTAGLMLSTGRLAVCPDSGSEVPRRILKYLHSELPILSYIVIYSMLSLRRRGCECVGTDGLNTICVIEPYSIWSRWEHRWRFSTQICFHHLLAAYL